MITINSKLQKTKVDDFLDLVYTTSKNEADLSERPFNEFKKAYIQGRILIACDNLNPIGWLITIPYTHKVQELASGFVFDNYRSKGIFSKLIKIALSRYEISLTVTFNTRLENHFKKQFDFRKSNPREAIILSRGKFLLNRLNAKRIKAIFHHYQSGRPKYLIFNRHE